MEIKKIKLIIDLTFCQDRTIWIPHPSKYDTVFFCDFLGACFCYPGLFAPLWTHWARSQFSVKAKENFTLSTLLVRLFWQHLQRHIIPVLRCIGHSENDPCVWYFHYLNDGCTLNEDKTKKYFPFSKVHISQEMKKSQQKSFFSDLGELPPHPSLCSMLSRISSLCG